MIISKTENSQLFNQLIDNPENYNKFAGRLREFNRTHKNNSIKIPATFVTPFVLHIDNLCVNEFMSFAKNAGCILN